MFTIFGGKFNHLQSLVQLGFNFISVIFIGLQSKMLIQAWL